MTEPRQMRDMMEQLLRAVTRESRTATERAFQRYLPDTYMSIRSPSNDMGINPFRAMRALERMHDLRQQWPHMVGKNLVSLTFDPNLEPTGLTTMVPGMSEYGITLGPDAIGYGGNWEGAHPRELNLGPLAYDVPGHLAAHEVGHGINLNIRNLASGLDPRLDLSMERGVNAAMKSQALLDRIQKVAPFVVTQSPSGKIDIPIPKSVRQISGYAQSGYGDNLRKFIDRLGTEHQWPKVRLLDEPFSEAFAALSDARASRYAVPFKEYRNAVGQALESPLTQALHLNLPSIQEEAGSIRPGSLAAGLGLAALPLAAMAVPKARNFIERGMIGAQIGGIPGAIAGVASQLIPGLHS